MTKILAKLVSRKAEIDTQGESIESNKIDNQIEDGRCVI